MSLVFLTTVLCVCSIFFTLKSKKRFLKVLLSYNLVQLFLLATLAIIISFDMFSIVDFEQFGYFHLVRIGIAILYKLTIFVSLPLNIIFMIYILFKKYIYHN